MSRKLALLDRFRELNRPFYGDLVEALATRACYDDELFECLEMLSGDWQKPMKPEVIYWLAEINRVMDGGFVAQVAYDILGALREARLLGKIGNESVRNLVTATAKLGEALYAFKGSGMHRAKAKYFVLAFGLRLVRSFSPGLSRRLKLAPLNGNRITIDDAAA